MKRTKFMLGALVLSVGLLGVGYAAWSDTLVINTTVTTGVLDVDYVIDSVTGSGSDEYGKDADDVTQVTVGKYTSTLMTGSNKENDTAVSGKEDYISFGITGLVQTTDGKPGATVQFQAVNTGDVDVKCTGVSLVNNTDVNPAIKFKVKASETYVNDAPVALSGLPGLIEQALSESVTTTPPAHDRVLVTSKKSTAESQTQTPIITIEVFLEATANDTQGLPTQTFDLQIDWAQNISTSGGTTSN